MSLREKIESYSQNKTGKEFVAGFDHFKRVYATARKISSMANYDDEILHAACFLHDIEIEEPHARLSAKKARKFLETISFPKEKIEAVVEAIKWQVPSMRPESMEAKILHDADLLDFLGAVGIVRLSAAASCRWNKSSMNDALEAIKKHRDLCYKNLILDRSKEMAEDKIKFMDDAIKQIEREIEC
jgi:uncharacterized protein